MPRGIILIIALVLLMVGCSLVLSGRVKEQPVRQIEVDVPANAAAH